MSTATQSHPVQASAAAQFFLADSRSLTGDNIMFWAAGGGYTSNVANAEPFSEGAAFRQNASRSSDIPWPADYVLSHSRKVVDMQYLRGEDLAAPEYANAAEFYLQQPGYVGNDILLAAVGGGTTTNLAKARIFKRDELLDGLVQSLRATPWPMSYLEKKSRPAAHVKQVNLKDALKGVARELRKPERKHVERYRCHGCGIFMSQLNYYTKACRCGAENRP